MIMIHMLIRFLWVVVVVKSLIKRRISQNLFFLECRERDANEFSRPIRYGTAASRKAFSRCFEH